MRLQDGRSAYPIYAPYGQYLPGGYFEDRVWKSDSTVTNTVVSQFMDGFIIPFAAKPKWKGLSVQIDIPVLRIVDQKHTQGFVFHEYSNLYRPSGVLEWSVRVDSQPYVREYIIRRLDEYDFSLSDWSFTARYYRDTTGWGFSE